MNWDFPCKMFFNPDLRKQAQEVIFSRKIKKLFYPTILLKNIQLYNSLLQKHPGLTLDIKLKFLEHIKVITKKIVKLQGPLRNF